MASLDQLPLTMLFVHYLMSKKMYGMFLVSQQLISNPAYKKYAKKKHKETFDSLIVRSKMLKTEFIGTDKFDYKLINADLKAFKQEYRETVPEPLDLSSSTLGFFIKVIFIIIKK